MCVHDRERERQREGMLVCEMTDSSPWALAGSVECVCVTEGLTAGRIGDMSRPGDRGLLTAGAHRHTHTRTTTLITSQMEEVEIV